MRVDFTTGLSILLLLLVCLAFAVVGLKTLPADPEEGPPGGRSPKKPGKDRKSDPAQDAGPAHRSGGN